MSKIQSESKSQLNKNQSQEVYCCGIYVKDTIWKQITTTQIVNRRIKLLWYLCQRYNLKANHNKVLLNQAQIIVVVSMSKIQSESKSQQGYNLIDFFVVVVSMSKIQSESKSQQNGEPRKGIDGCGIYVKDTIWKQITTGIADGSIGRVLWYLCQRYNLKANHNYFQKKQELITVVVSMSKIQSESKSQHAHCIANLLTRCGIYVKDTIWKQITTRLYPRFRGSWLWYLCQRYNLKANHNPLLAVHITRNVVVSMSKIQSESKSQQLTVS